VIGRAYVNIYVHNYFSQTHWSVNWDFNDEWKVKVKRGSGIIPIWRPFVSHYRNWFCAIRYTFKIQQ